MTDCARLITCLLGASLLSFMLSALFAGTSMAQVCPATPDGTILTHPSLDPAPARGEPQPTPDGLLAFARERGLTRVSDLLAALPAWYRKYYALVRTTRGTGHASLQSPRIVFFGPDAGLLINAATDPADPHYNRLDVAALDRVNGEWEFSQLDFSAAAPTLSHRPPECTQCHGQAPRPIWGSYLDWPGIIGDDPRPGLQAETLIPEEADRLNVLRAGGGSDRFASVRWAERPYRAGEAQFLPDNRYGYALTISNNQIGQAHAASIFQRMKGRFPQRYLDLREAILLLGPLSREGKGPSSIDLGNIAARMARYGLQGTRLEDLFSALGIDVRKEVSLDVLASNSAVNLGWNSGSGNILELVYVQMLYDLAQGDVRLRSLLTGVKKGTGVYGIWECPELGENVWDILRYRMTQGWKLRGAARAAEHAVFYPIDNTRVQQPIFEPTAGPLQTYLSARLASDGSPTQQPGTRLTISGVIRVNGRAVANATVSGAQCAPSAADGSYRCDVESGFTGTLRPSYLRKGLPAAFNPRIRRYSGLQNSLTAQDFAGSW